MSPHYLRYVINSCIVMTYGPRQRYPKSRASQSCSHSTARVRPTARSRRAAGTRLFHFSPAGISLSARSASVGKAAGRHRAQAGVYGETAAQLDSAGAVVRICQEPVHQRSGEPCLGGTAATRARAWLRVVPLETFAWNIGSIVCWKRNWHKSFKSWRRKRSAALAQSPKPRRP